jgi:hypothetical protein
MTEKNISDCKASASNNVPIMFTLSHTHAFNKLLLISERCVRETTVSLSLIIRTNSNCKLHIQMETKYGVVKLLQQARTINVSGMSDKTKSRVTETFPSENKLQKRIADANMYDPSNASIDPCK